MRSRLIDSLGLEEYAFLVPDYWFMLTLALILGTWMTLRRSRRYGLNSDTVAQTLFYSLLLLFPSARLVYALQYWDQFASAPWSLVNPLQGGLALIGGLAGFLAGAVCLERRGQSVGTFLDAAAPSLAFGLFLGRIGCFLAGCNWGKTTQLWSGVCFPPPHHAWRQHVQAGLIPPSDPLSLPVHPTQLYEAFLGLAVSGLSLLWLRREYPGDRARQPGKTFLLALSAYAVFRFFIEYIRADAGGLRFGPISVAQGLSLTIIIVCLIALRTLGRRKTRPSEI